MTIKGIGEENLIYMYDKSKHDQIRVIFHWLSETK